MKSITISWFRASFWLFCSLFISTPVLAQVTVDGTTSTTVTSPDGNNFTINDGDRAGSNLFHSFQDFSVPNGGEAFFNNDDAIENIFSRVTGGNISNIDGLIRANSSANLFLINPAGIIFGENASLNIGGSFYGSTADSILFENGEFSATDLNDPPLLTINAPIGLNFRDNPGDIVNTSNSGQSRIVTFERDNRSEEVSINTPIGLEVNSGQNLTLIGGNILLDGGELTAPGGRVELGGLSTAGEIVINENGSLDFPEGIAKADVSLTNNSEVNVSAGGGGFISVNANNLILSEGSELFAGIAENMGSNNAQAGDIFINADESVQLIGNGIDIEGLDTVISNHVGISAIKRENPDSNSTARGNGGSIFIETNRLELSNRGVISAITFSQGNAGSVKVKANDVVLNTLGEIASRARQGAKGNANNVELTVDSLTIDNSFIVSDVGDFGDDNGEVAIGNGGNVIIDAQDSVTLGSTEGFSIILSQVQKNGRGNAGDVNITTSSLSLLENGSLILTTNAGEGQAGNININASKIVNLEANSNLERLNLILSQLLSDAVGNGGDINISAPIISLTNFSKISTSARPGSIGQPGNITLNADTITLTSGSTIDALTENDFDGGNIDINANLINLSDGGKIVASGDSSGNAGSINLNVTNTISINNDNPPSDSPFPERILQDIALEAGLFASTIEGSTGNGGNINVQSGSIELINNGSLSATTASGIGGNINLQIDDTLSLQENNLISAEANGLGDGGNVDINTKFIIATPNQNNDIIASAEDGTGGRITIDAEGIFGIQVRSQNERTNDIDASGGVDGEVIINTPDVDVTQGLLETPQNVVEPEQTTAQACQSDRLAGRTGGLTIEGKGGVPPEPIEPLNSDNILVDGQVTNPNPQTQHPEIKPIKTSRGDIIPARGIVKTEGGRIILTAYPTNSNTNRIPHGSTNCN